MTIGNNVSHFRQLASERECKLVAISKTKSKVEILEAYEAGQRDFGENKAQEMAGKHEILPGDIAWHMVGHLQSNKVKYISSFVSLIHSVDSLKLLTEINKCGDKAGRIIPCLLQVHISDEETKFGFDENDLFAFMNNPVVYRMNKIHIKGLMGIATFTDDAGKVRMEFRKLKSIFDKARSMNFSDNITFEILSMGMSDDFEIALEEGSNLIRIGTAIFGERKYNE